MINLKDVISKYPECLESSEKLRAYLTDLYPNEKAKVSIIVAIFNCGIAEEIKDSSSIDKMMLSRYCDKLENDFGYSSKLSQICLECWAEAYDKGTLIQPTPVLAEDLPAEHSSVKLKTAKPKVQKAKTTKPQSDFIIKDGVLTGCKKIKAKNKSIEIPNGVLRIDDYAFRGYYNLENVAIPSSVTRIGNGAFANCQLSSVIIPEGVVTIGYAAFNCYSLKSIYISSSVTDIGSHAFPQYSLEEIVVSENNPTFHSCNNCLIHTKTKTLILACKNSIIPSDGSVTKIGDGAGLYNADIPDCITEIGSNAFIGENINHIHIPSSVKNINPNAFSLTKIKKITVDNNNTVFHSEGNCLIETNTKTLIVGCESSIIPTDGSVRKIGDWAFSGIKFKTIKIPQGISKIGYDAFDGCYELESIVLPNSMTNIKKDAFRHCKKLSKIIIPSSVEHIGYTFEDCDNLTIYTSKGSFAEKYAMENHIRCLTELIENVKND